MPLHLPASRRCEGGRLEGPDSLDCLAGLACLVDHQGKLRTIRRELYCTYTTYSIYRNLVVSAPVHQSVSRKSE